MFNTKGQVDHRQGSMIDGRTVSRLQPRQGSQALRLDLGDDDSVQLKSVRITRASPLLTPTSTSMLYELEVTTSQGMYYIDRTYEELEELHTILKEFSVFKHVKKSAKGMIKRPAKPAKMAEHMKKLNQRFELFVKKAGTVAGFRKIISPRARARHFLFIDILEARNLISTDVNGRSDPYLRIAMIDDTGNVLGSMARTAVVHKTLNPVWEEQVAFDLNDSISAISLSCWDRDRVSRDDFMGRIILNKKDIPHNREIVRFFPLHPSKARKDTIHGEVKLRIHYKTCLPGGIDLDVKPNEDINEEAIAVCREERERRQRRLEKKRFAGELQVSTLYNPPLGNWGGYLTITVVQGKKLSARDSGGTSDPYVVVLLNGKRYRTKKISSSLEPVWDETFYFHVPAGSVEGLVLEVDVYDWDVVGKSDLIGDAYIRIEDLKEGYHEHWLTIVGPPPTQEGLDKKLGKRMAEEGWAPNLPIILVPGFGSTSLEVVEGYEKWKGQRVWLSLSKISRQALSFRRFRQGRVTRRLDGLKTEEMEAIEDESWAAASSSSGSIDPVVELAFKNRWIQHMCLHEDGISDPEGIKVRPVKGKDAVTYLDPGALTAPLSYVMGPLVENLEQLGYVYGDNLLAAGYDWRLPLHHLEERDGYFSQLKTSVEEMRKRNNSPVVLLGHSMGNRVIQYFLNWILHTSATPEAGRKWVSQNVHTFVAVGAPWLGASKTIRGLATGEKFGMDAFLTDLEALTFAHRIASTACLLPVGCEKGHHHLPSFFESFTHLTASEESEQSSKPLPYRDFLVKEADATRPIHFYEEYMRKNPLFGGDHKNEYILKPPPVERLYAIYGVNLDTEIGYIFQKDEYGRAVLNDNLAKAQRAQFEAEGYAYRKGTIWETPHTKQGIIQELTGVTASTCGDGTVSYASLNHCARWRNEIPKLKIEELEGAEHREILANRLFFKKLIEYVAERNIIGNHADLGELASRLRLKAESFLALPDIKGETELSDLIPDTPDA